MKSYFRLVIIPFILFVTVVLFSQVSATPAAAGAYLEPGLQTSAAVTVSVIVTADDSRQAAQAVERLGGTVSSDLWLIDAVAATLPAHQLEALAAQPGIVSVVHNKDVGVSYGPECDPNQTYESGPCARYQQGWVTDRREKKGGSTLPQKQNAPLVGLPDGRFVAAAEKDVVTFLNPDGSEQMQVPLEIEKVTTAPAIGPDGTIYISGEKPDDATHRTRYVALNPDGSVRWIFEKKDMVPGLAVGLDGNIYINDYKDKIYILDAATGQVLDDVRIKGDKPGQVELPPAVGPDGTVYWLSSGKMPDKDDRKVNLIALDPDLLLSDPGHSELWQFTGQINVETEYPPLVGDNGLVYLANRKSKRVDALHAATGQVAFTFNTAEEIKLQPVTGADGSLYVLDKKNVYALNPDGSLRFTFQLPADEFLMTPAFSPDGAILYAPVKELLYALDTATGVEVGQIELDSDISASPAVDAEGNLYVGTDDKSLRIINPSGQVFTRLRLPDKVVQPALALVDEQRLVVTDHEELFTIGYMPDSWDGRDDVEPGDLNREWRLSNAIPVDVGADLLHETLLPDGSRITGAGVGVAVLDTGVQFSGKVKDILGSELDDLFIGQVDFVGDGFCRNNGDQYDGYCFDDHDKSLDDYGHGSHIAGIIWSQITDYHTGVNMGIAPQANILSVRVLGPHGAGNYEDLIQGIQYVVQHKNEHNIRVMNLSLSSYVTTPYFVDPLNRAVEAAWANGIVVVAAAGNEGPGAESITSPGNDPYVITVGAIDNNRTPGFWADDILPAWSATGPTPDGFAKPDVLAPGKHIISFMYTDNDDEDSAELARNHPSYANSISLFRMNGTSQATAVTSGVAAMMLQVQPNLSPDQVKFRLMYSSNPAITGDGDLVYTYCSRAWVASGRPPPCWAISSRPMPAPTTAWILRPT
jgi:outer membrane protein assembly factor BamB